MLPAGMALRFGGSNVCADAIAADDITATAPRTSARPRTCERVSLMGRTLSRSVRRLPAREGGEHERGLSAPLASTVLRNYLQTSTLGSHFGTVSQLKSESCRRPPRF